MELNNAQKAALKAAITADGTLGALLNTTAAADRIARQFNRASDPAVIVWRTSVSKSDVLERIDVADVSALTAANRDVLRIYLAGEVVPCDRARVRAAFAAIFSGTNTATRLNNLFQRTATRAEALFATGGDGSAGNPHSLVREGELTTADVEAARV